MIRGYFIPEKPIMNEVSTGDILLDFDSLASSKPSTTKGENYTMKSSIVMGEKFCYRVFSIDKDSYYQVVSNIYEYISYAIPEVVRCLHLDDNTFIVVTQVFSSDGALETVNHIIDELSRFITYCRMSNLVPECDIPNQVKLYTSFAISWAGRIKQ